ncbi:hypothetical protein DMENIID0001_117110 [Sergentomyia squamirostris]
MRNLLRDESFTSTSASETYMETDTEPPTPPNNENHNFNLDFKRRLSNTVAGVGREIVLEDELNISFPAHRAVIFPKDQCFSYICESDTDEEGASQEIVASGQSLDKSDIISDQDLRYQKEILIVSQNHDIPAIPESEIVDDSCVAVFHDISHEVENVPEDLTFNGKIPSQKASIHVSVEEMNDLFNNTSTTIFDSSQASLQIDLSATGNLNTTQLTNTEKEYGNTGSPDILAWDSEDDEAVGNTTDERTKCDISLLDQSIQGDGLKERERKMFRRLQNALAGVLPPPSVTKSLLSVETLLSVYEKNKSVEFSSCEEINADLETLMKPLNTVDEAKDTSWPDIRDIFTHGVHYNRSKWSEKWENLSVKYAERFIGAETGSSFVKLNSPTSSKKRYLRDKSLNQSPGRRLSHLAKRKAMFSCANLQKKDFSSSQPCLSQPSSSRQILLGPQAGRRGRLIRVRTPKRLSPPQRKTPHVPPTRETSKRALFQSPPQQAPPRSAPTPEMAEKMDRSRRALFSSPKQLSRYSSFSQQSSSSFSTLSQGGQTASTAGLTAAALANRENMLDDETGGKRKRELLDDEEHVSVRKMPRMEGFGRSQSFTAEYVARQNALLATRTSLCKTTSDVCLSGRTSQSNCLTDLEKQKLLYIVSQTLQRKQISGQHEHFKEYATVMAKVVKRLFLESNRNTFSSVSEQMNKIANNISFAVLQGKSVEEIYAVERKKRELARNSQKPSGYISMESYRSGIQRSTSSVLSEKSLSFNQSENLSQSSLFGVDTGSILRENVDSEQRRSAQKGLFSGKDQKNVSPHKSSQKKKPKLVGGKNLSNLLKAKRQISFDT